jgi:hypothetical protein
MCGMVMRVMTQVCSKLNAHQELYHLRMLSPQYCVWGWNIWGILHRRFGEWMEIVLDFACCGIVIRDSSSLNK